MSYSRRTGTAAKRCLAVAAAAGLALAASACGGGNAQAGSSSPTGCPSSGSVDCGSPPTTVQPPTTTSTTSIANDLTNIGTVTKSDDIGTTLTTSYAISPLLTNDNSGNPPPAALPALSACNENYTSVTSRSLYVHGQITLTYQGNLPGTIAVDPTEDVAEFPTPGTNLGEDVELRGTWLCSGNSSSYENSSIVLANGQSVVMDLWVLAPVLTNAQPSLTESGVPQWAFLGSLGSDGSDSLSNIQFSGPHATTCTQTGGDNNPGWPDQTRLGMFQAPAYTLSDPNSPAFGIMTFQCNPI